MVSQRTGLRKGLVCFHYVETLIIRWCKENFEDHLNLADYSYTEEVESDDSRKVKFILSIQHQFNNKSYSNVLSKKNGVSHRGLKSCGCKFR